MKWRELKAAFSAAVLSVGSKNGLCKWKKSSRKVPIEFCYWAVAFGISGVGCCEGFHDGQGLGFG